jgi:hypothetical protein
MFTYNCAPFGFPKTSLMFAVLWIMILMDSHQTKRWDPDQRDKLVTDPDPHQSDKSDPGSGSASIFSWNMTLFEHVIQVLSLYLDARIRIWIRIKVKGKIRIWIRIKVTSRTRIRIKVTKRIRIRVKVK